MRIPAGPFYEKWVEVYWNGSRCGVRVIKNYDGSVDIPCRYESNIILSGDTIALKYNGKWGVLDHQNHTLCNHIYERIEKPDYRPRLCMAMKEGKWGLIDNCGGPVTAFNYDQIKPLTIKTYSRKEYNGSRGYSQRFTVWALYNAGQVFAYNDAADMIYPRGFDNIYKLIQVGKPCLVVEKDLKQGLLGLDGTMITRCEYEDIQQLQPYIDDEKACYSYAIVKKSGKWGVIGEEHQLLLNCEFDKIAAVGQAIALKHDNKWGVLSKEVLYQFENDSRDD